MGEYYTGFVADHYDLLVPEDETKSYRLFRSVIEGDGQPALELACGTGRPLPGDFSEMSTSEWRVAREARRPEDGATVRCLAKLLDVDYERRTYETLFRYQLIEDGEVSYQEDRRFLLHWHTQDQFAGLLADAGYADIHALRGNGKASQATDRLFVFSARASARC